MIIPKQAVGLCRRYRDIRHLTDVVTVGVADDGAVEIRIAFDRVDPPAGRLWSLGPLGGADDAPLRFTGWLGLLRVLYEVLERPGDGPSAGA